MARNRKAQTKKKSQNNQNELESQATHFFDHQNYKAAILSYKNLLKIEQRPEWQQQLAHAYLHHSDMVAEQALYQEATVLWENYAQLCDQPQQTDDYLQWLAYSAQYPKIIKFLKNNPDLDHSAISKINALLGAALLSGKQNIDSLLSDDHPVIIYYPFAKQALHAYCQNDSHELEDNLKQIAFRSPYKDFKSLLKALLVFKSDPNTALSLLKKIPVSSPYYKLAQSCQLHDFSDPQKLIDFVKQDKQQRLFVQKLIGLDKLQIKLLNNCQRILTHYTDKQAFELVLKNSTLFGELKSQQFIGALLPYYPAGKKLLKKSFALSEFENNRIRALTYEQKNEAYDAVPLWHHCIKILERKNHPKNALKIAMIMRHVAELVSHDRPQMMELLENSLSFDADDKSSYLKLIELTKENNDKQKKTYWLAQALKKYPQDMDILMLNTLESMQKKAFKKAAGFAGKLLKIDPINLQAKTALINCHIAHTRKLIKSAKYELASKELAQAQGIDRGKNEKGSMIILQGLLAFKMDDKQPCVKLFEQGRQAEKGELCRLFRLYIEILGVGLKISSVMSFCMKADKKYRASVEEIMALMAMINLYDQYGNEFIDKAFDKIKTQLKNAIIVHKKVLSFEECIILCECFIKIDDFKMLGVVSNAVEGYYLDELIFSYYIIYAKIKGHVSKLKQKDILELNDILEYAKQQDDKRVIEKIATLLMKYQQQNHNPFKFGFWEEDEDEEISTEIDKLACIIDEVTGLDGDEFFSFLFDGKPPTQQQIIMLKQSGDEGFQRRVVNKILQKAGIDKENLKDSGIEEFILESLF